MTSVLPIPVPLNDSALLKAAATPRTRLFPILSRASAFAPLIVVCCVLPAIRLLAEPTLNEEASLWGLRSLAVASATTYVELLEPGLNEQGQPLIFQPPLAAWSNGLVIRILGPSQVLSSSLVSLVATGIAIWLTTRLAWRMGGANTSLIAALLMCSHPQVLELAITPTNGSVGFCLLLASVFGFQRHLEGKSTSVSSNLIIGSAAWGLALLAVGPPAIIVPLVFLFHAFNQKFGIQPEFAGRSFRNQIVQGWPVLRSTFIFTGIGLLIGGWWEIVMAAKYGGVFWTSWWTSFPAVCLTNGTNEWRCDIRPLLQPSWQEWFIRNALLVGWMIVGLERAWHECRSPSSELARRRYQLLVLWWMIAFVARILAQLEMISFNVCTSVWDLALVMPTLLLAALGFGTLIERSVSRRGEFCLMILLVCLAVTRISTSWLTGLSSAALVAVLLVCGPMLFRVPGRTETGWSEKGWRQLLQITVYASLFACLSFGFGDQCSPSTDEPRLAELRSRLAAFPDVRRVSLLVTRDPVPVTLRYLLRCRWPQAEVGTSEGWDAGLTKAMNEESQSPHSRFLILEWSRRDIRLTAETGLSWQLTSVGDPMQYRGRRLSLTLVEPRT